MKNSQIKLLFGLSLCAGLLSACNSNNTSKDTPRKGQKTFYSDESFRPLMETAGYTFMGVYPNAELNFVYTSETEAMNALSKGKTRTIFVSRDFTDEEKAKLKTNRIQVRSEIFAHDAVIFIVNNAMNDTLLSTEELRAILTGKSEVWPVSKQKIEVVLDRVQSANFNFMLNWLDGASFGKQVHATKSTDELIDYVQKHPNTLGVIGYNYVSDLDDKTVRDRLEKFRIVAIGDENKDYWRANKACITEKKYPFTRPIWYINTGAPDGLNSGYVNFLSSRQGQLLLEKCELGPGKGTPREINFITE